MIRVYDREHALKLIDRLEKFIEPTNVYKEAVSVEMTLSHVKEILATLKYLANVVDVKPIEPKQETKWIYFYCGQPHPSAHHQYFPSKCPPHMMREYEYMGKTEVVKEEIDE